MFNVAAMAVAMAQKRALNSDALLKKLESRPSTKELQERNIMKDSDGASPALLAARENLKKKKLGDDLGHKIVERPNRTELLDRGILRNG